jgi:hypothetical protein
MITRLATLERTLTHIEEHGIDLHPEQIILAKESLRLEHAAVLTLVRSELAATSTPENNTQ